MTKVTNIKKMKWREKYIKILQYGPDESENQYAAELIEGGYANGMILKNHTGSGDPISKIIWKGTTPSGREYIDDLQDSVKRQTLRFKILAFITLSLTWIFGAISQAFIQWFTCQ